jgi:Zn-dependent M28 family amino/carboxypeptidase
MRRHLAVLIPVLISAACLQAAQSATPKFNGQRALDDIRQLVAIGPRVAGTSGAQAARDYIRKQLQAVGVAVEEQPFDATTPNGRVKMVNLRATFPAAGGMSKSRLVIGGHYDTKLFKEFTFVGANDGGSSAAFLIELARVLKARKSPVTIELLFLDGEEAVFEWAGSDHTYGSRHYVATAKKDGSLATLKAFVLVDMIGDHDLRIKRDLNSTSWLTTVVWDAARQKKLDRYFAPESTAIEDDHLEFTAASVPSVDIIDLEFDAWHTSGDTLNAVSAGSLQIVGDVVLAALPQIEARLK